MAGLAVNKNFRREQLKGMDRKVSSKIKGSGKLNYGDRHWVTQLH